MRKFSQALLIAILAAAAAFIVPSPRAASDSSGFEVPMKFIGSMPAVEVMVNGQGPFLFGIDTGGQGKARVDSSLVERLGLKTTGQTRASDSSGQNAQTLETVQLASIEVGDLHFTEVEATARNYRASPRMAQLDGILTLNLFADYLVTFDYPGKIVRAQKGELPKADGAEVIDYKSEGGVPVVALNLGSVPVTAHIDSGNMIGGFVVPAAVAEKLAFAAEPAVVGRARSISGEVEIKEGRLKDSARLGRHEFREPVITFPAPSDFANIGSKMFDQFAITFDQRNNRLRLVRKNAD